MPRSVVVLVPGFLGFKRLGNFTYFAERVVDQLKRHGHFVRTTRTVPTGTLAARQDLLLGELHWILRTCEAGELHLVGHSTGGVDGWLLTAREPLPPKGRWDTDRDREVRSAIRTVVSIASPHHGTCLATSSLAQVFSGGAGLSFSSLSSLASAVLALGPAILWDRMVLRLLAAACADPVSVVRYLADVLGDGELIAELRPENMARIRDAYELDTALDVRFRSVVTMAGQETSGYFDPITRASHDRREPDAFFKQLYRHASGADGRCGDPSALEPTVDLLSSMRNAWIMNPDTVPYPVDAALNDGVVNACRQMVTPGDAGELLAAVVADHIDVLGYYPHDARDAAARRELEKNGILHSGSGFTDEQFIRLYEVVASAI